MNHKQKVKLARRMSGKQSGHFESPQWEERKAKIEKRIQPKGGK